MHYARLPFTSGCYAFAQQWHDVPAFIALTDHGFADEEEVANAVEYTQ
jgi:hypothetical protein